MDSESVYNLIPPAEVKAPKQALYVSKHSKTPPGAKPKRQAATFGKTNNAANPGAFLKKNGGRGTATTAAAGALPADLSGTRHRTERKPGVPSKDERPVMGLVSSKNYITANAVDNILAVPRRPQDTAPNYLEKPDFGQVPQYLGRVKAQIDEEYKMIQSLQEAPDQTSQQLKMLSEEDRLRMLDGLKANWERINKQYQTLSFSVDTASKKRRKEEYEAMLEQIEKDIKKLQKGFIFVADDSAMGY